MSIDLSKLSPAPWTVHKASHEDADPDEAFVLFGGGTHDYDRDSTMIDTNHASFIALARNAFDVMMRRGWSVEQWHDGRWSLDHVIRPFCWTDAMAWPDPFTALVEADKWYVQKEQVTSS